MTYLVTVLPSVVLCGKCGAHMRFDDLKRGATTAFGWCPGYDCEQKDVRLIFPLEVRELERAE